MVAALNPYRQALQAGGGGGPGRQGPGSGLQPIRPQQQRQAGYQPGPGGGRPGGEVLPFRPGGAGAPSRVGAPGVPAARAGSAVYRGHSDPEAYGEPGKDRVVRMAREQAQGLETQRLGGSPEGQWGDGSGSGAGGPGGRGRGDGSLRGGAGSRFASRAEEGLYDPDGSYSPYSYGGESWRDGIRRAMPDPKNRIFNKAGTLNAYDTKDALQQIAHLLQQSSREARQARFHRQANEIVPAERRRILAAAVQDPEGFAILGQELLLPIKDLVDYEAVGRRFFRVRPLEQGEFFRATKDIRATAWVIGQDGQGLEARLYGRWVTPTEFKLGSFPTIDIEDIYTANYDLLDRAQDTARQEIELEEDKRARAVIDAVARTRNAVTTYVTLGVGAFEDVRFQVERHRLVVEKFWINRAELSDIVKTMSAAVDPVTERELILAGYIGSFLNAMITTSAGTGVQEVVPAGTFYATTGPEHLGEMTIRVELFSEPFNMFAMQRFVKGFAFGEIVGWLGPNPNAAAVGVK